jgi:hypothetical protein
MDDDDDRTPIEDRLIRCAGRPAGYKVARLLRDAAIEIVRLREELESLKAARVAIGAALRSRNDN